jgi:tryptophanyl-tRNA synthetase
LSGEGKEAVLKEYGGRQFSEFKSALADLSVAKLAPIGEEISRLTSDPVEIDKVLADGSARAAAIAAPIMRDVKDIVGFIQS